MLKQNTNKHESKKIIISTLNTDTLSYCHICSYLLQYIIVIFLPDF